MTATALPRIEPVSPQIRRARWQRRLRKFGFALAVIVIVSPAILVFLWMLSLSLKNEIDNLAYPPVLIPDPPTLRNFVQVFADNSMGLYFWNSIVVSGCATLLALAVGIPAGYGIARTQAHRITAPYRPTSPPTPSRRESESDRDAKE